MCVFWFAHSFIVVVDIHPSSSGVRDRCSTKERHSIPNFYIFIRDSRGDSLPTEGNHSFSSSKRRGSGQWWMGLVAPQCGGQMVTEHKGAPDTSCFDPLAQPSQKREVSPDHLGLCCSINGVIKTSVPRHTLCRVFLGSGFRAFHRQAWASSQAHLNSLET